MKHAFRYRLDRKIRALAMWAFGLVTTRSNEVHPEWKKQRIERILLIRGIFRLGDSILAIPAILLFRRNFPHAIIDFVGPSVSKRLFRTLPIDHYYEIHRRFPEVCWTYWALLRQIRSANYDLAVDVSGSKAAMGAFIVGLSGARFRAGLQGKWDRWFNVRLPRPAEKNKYRNLPVLVGAMGLQTSELFPRLILSPEEEEKARKQLQAAAGPGQGPIVGVFVGGRKTRGKRWPKENFLDLITGLRRKGAKVVTFMGPEEKEWVGFFRQTLPPDVPLVFESSLQMFAAMVSNCDLFVACDSGPIHLACALQVRTVAIFLKNNFDRWGPPSALGRIVYERAGISAGEVVKACLVELSGLSSNRSKVSGTG